MMVRLLIVARGSFYVVNHDDLGNNLFRLKLKPDFVQGRKDGRAVVVRGRRQVVRFPSQIYIEEAFDSRIVATSNSGRSVIWS